MKSLLQIDPIKYINGNLYLPGSKSISVRALLLSAQSIGSTKLINLLNSEDIQYMLQSLRRMGVSYQISKNKKVCEIIGLSGPISVNELDLFVGNSGTTMRFLTAALCLKSRNINIFCNRQMKNRPIGSLVNALLQGGAQIDYIEKNNYPPIKLVGGFQGGNIFIDGNISSQFVSALLMMAPQAPNDSKIFIKNSMVSKPYIDITISIMKKFGINIYYKNYNKFYVPGNQKYISPKIYHIEGDATNASYFLLASAIRGGTVRVNGIDKKSIQGDVYFANILEKMGANIKFGHNFIECKKNYPLRAIDIDMNDFPDIAMSVMIASIFIKNEITTIRNIGTLKLKETDRIKSMSSELRKVGAFVFEKDNCLSIVPPKKIISSYIHTYNDHRMAMCFSLVAISGVQIKICNPMCVNKTFPNFFKSLKSLSIFS